MRLGAVLLLSWLPACGGSVSLKAAPTAVQEMACPGTVSQAIGSACATEGQSCFPEYSCGEAAAIATCTCSAGRFACKDILGAALSSGAPPGCPAALPQPLACPASLQAARFTACGQPEAGAPTAGALFCTYASPCASIPAYVMCQCVLATPSSGASYFRYECPDLCAATDGGSVTPEASSDTTSHDAEAGGASSDASVRDSAVSAPSDSAADATGEASAAAHPSDASAD